MATLQSLLFLLPLLLSISSTNASSFTLFTAKSAATKTSSRPVSTNGATATRSNPFTAKAAAIRYWDRKIPGGGAHPSFLLSKLSPLSAPDAATFSSLAASDPSSLTARLSALCSAARLLCAPTITPSLESHPKDSNFASYENINFTNYGTGVTAGQDSFKNYSDSLNVPVDTFRRYSRDSTGHDDSFTSYSVDGNVVTTNFTSYATTATGGSGSFSTYHSRSNVPDVKFTNYDADANGRIQTFTSYADDTNAGDQSFSGYGKHGNGIPTTFTSYANNSNVIGSNFANYGEEGNGAVDSFTNYGQNGNGPGGNFRSYGSDSNAATDNFTSYGFNGNVPENTFRSYASGGNAATESFASYRDQANVGDDTFQSYGTGDENNPNLKFTNYGNSFNEGSDRFKSYAEGANDPKVGFKGYNGDLTDFKGYAKTGVTFTDYKNASVVPSGFSASTSGTPLHAMAAAAGRKSGKMVNRWVEPGKFFRESNLKEGTVMPMPDIRDKMPERSFLPRTISGKLPFNATVLSRIFNAPADTALGRAIGDTIAECARAPSRGETKRCPTSAEDMIDFAAEVIGSSAVPRSTESAKGSGGDIMVGKVKGVDGGKVTKSVSCHQSLFPYLVYYCHSVPKVRVYEADILAVHTKEKINHAVAICHLDTSDWSAEHGAFVALGSKPGEIEVCHWIFQGDMTWSVAN